VPCLIAAPNETVYIERARDHICVWQMPEPEDGEPSERHRWRADACWLTRQLEHWGVFELPPPDLDEGLIRWRIPKSK
jgi:hypothetical protein